MKVYCKGCKWYERHSFTTFIMPIELCICPETAVHKDTYYQHHSYHPHPKNVNVNNDCKYFERGEHDNTNN